MSVRNLDFLFRPCSVAVIGASNLPASIGIMVSGVALNASFAHTHPDPGHIAFVN